MKNKLGSCLVAALVILNFGTASGQEKEIVVKLVQSPIERNAKGWCWPPPYHGNTPPLIATLTHEVTTGAWNQDDVKRNLEKLKREGKQTFETYTAAGVDLKLREVEQCISQNEELAEAQTNDLERRLTTVIVSTAKTVPWAVYDDLRRELMTESEKQVNAQLAQLRAEIATLKQEIASLKGTPTPTDAGR